MAINRRTLQQALERETGFLFLTHNGEDHTWQCNLLHGTVPRKLAQDLTQGEMFEAATMGPPRGDLELIPQEDGLFPGFSQTWRVAR